MGNIILLDFITLDFINPYLFILNAYPYSFSVQNINYFILLYNYNSLDIVSLNFLNLDQMIYISLCKFFLSFNEFPLSFLYIYLVILIISIMGKIKLYLEFKSQIKKFILYINRSDFINLSLYLSYFYWNFFYLILFWVRKKTWNRLNFRSLELKKKKNPKYHQLQYIKFFYVKFMFDIFFSIVLRLLLFMCLFILRFIFFFIYSFLTYFLLRTDIFLVLFNLAIYKDILLKKLISLAFFTRIFSFLNYLKREFFIYFFNDRSFLGGFIYYIFNMIYYKIGIFYNSHNWENAEFETSNYLSRYYSKINSLFLNYKIKNSFFRINVDYLNLLIYLPIYIFFLILNLFGLFYKYFSSLRSYYNLVEVKYSIYLYWKYLILIAFTFYVSMSLNSFYILGFLIFILLVNLMANLRQKTILNIYLGDKYFYYLGFIVVYIFEIFKNFLYLFYLFLVHIFLKLKYLLVLIILYKLGIFCLLNIGLLNLISNYFEVTLFIFLDKFLYAFLDYYNLKNNYSYSSEFNIQLINIIAYDFARAQEDFQSYINNSFLNRIYTLNFKSIDFSRLSWKAFVDYQRSATRQITARKYYTNLFMEFIQEIWIFSVICKNYLLLKLLKFYYVYLLRHSDLNLYYYFFKKFYTLVYLIYIYIYFYLKWLYCYIVPLYIIPKSVISYIFIIYIWSYLFFTKIYFIFFNFSKLFLSFIFLSLLKSIYVFSFLRVSMLNIITFIYYIIYDLIFLLTSWKIIIFYPYHIIEWYLNYFVNKSLFRENLKDLFINYFRIPKKNLINFNLNESFILGGKLRSVSLLDIDSLNMQKVKDAGLMVHQMDDFIVASKPEIKHNRIFKNRDNLLIYSDIFLLFSTYYPSEYWLNFYMKEQWLLNFFLRKIIIYHLIDLYFIYYLFFYLLFFYLFKNKENFLNIDQMWKNLKDEFDYKLLNNNKLFIKALNYLQKNTGKRKKMSYLFKKLNNYWKVVQHNFLLTLTHRLRSKKNYRSGKKSISLGRLKSFAMINNTLKNFYLEKNLYYNNKFLFYWKNYLFFDKDTKFYQKYDKDNQFLYFFLSLIFRKNKYSSQIFFYFDTLNKMYFYNNELPLYLNKTYDIIKIYFNRLDSLLFKGIGDSWLLHKDLSLILYKDESLNQSDMYSLNFNVIIPYFEKFFFWFIIIIYLYFTKFHWRLTPHVDFLGRINRMMYLQSLIINDNFFYFYNLCVYWVNGYFMFDIKHFSYEYNDFVNEWTKDRRYFKHIRKSASFLVNNDPLFIHKKNYAYHLLWLDKMYHFYYTSFMINLFYLSRKILIIIILLIFYINLALNKKSYRWLFLNNYLDKLLYLLYFYSKNIINRDNYWNFYYKKILSNLEMISFTRIDKKK